MRHMEWTAQAAPTQALSGWQTRWPTPLHRRACLAQPGRISRYPPASLAQREHFPPSLEDFLQASAPLVLQAHTLFLHQAHASLALLVTSATPLYLFCPLFAGQARGLSMGAAHAPLVPVAFSLCRARRHALAAAQALSPSAQPAAAHLVPQVHSPLHPTPPSAASAHLGSIPMQLAPRPRQCVCRAQQAQCRRPPEQRRPSRASLAAQEDLQMLL